MPYKDLYAHQIDEFTKQAGAIIIDIRDIHSYNTGHMKNALHIDGPTMGGLIQQRKNNPPVLIYCYHGNSSRDMAEMILGMGFTNVAHLVGGWQAWMNYLAQNETEQAISVPQLTPAFS
jgi:thiosulfate sulfurtransferase